MTMRFAKGISTPRETGVVDVLFCHETFHAGSSRAKYEAMWAWAAAWPGVPGTRGWRRGVRRVPFSGERAASGEGIARRKESARGL